MPKNSVILVGNVTVVVTDSQNCDSFAIMKTQEL